MLAVDPADRLRPPRIGGANDERLLETEESAIVGDIDAMAFFGIFVEEDGRLDAEPLQIVGDGNKVGLAEIAGFPSRGARGVEKNNK